MKPQRRTHMKSVRVLVLHDAQTDMLPGEPGGAICVQRFDDSLSSAIHITYRSWLRSSSMHEPRDPPLEVVLFSFLLTDPTVLRRRILEVLKKFFKKQLNKLHVRPTGERLSFERRRPALLTSTQIVTSSQCTVQTAQGSSSCVLGNTIGNDPSAGSPTETLLRLLLPLNTQTGTTSQQSASAETGRGGANPKVWLEHSIGSSDGRCVQRAGT